MMETRRTLRIPVSAAALLVLTVVVVLGLTGTVSSARPWDEQWKLRAKRYDVKRKFPRTDLGTINTPGTRSAARNPTFLWSFLTSPDTPYLERMAVAHNQPFPPELLPKLVSARKQLLREQKLHHWAMMDNPYSARVYDTNGLRRLRQSPRLRQRNILGRIWTVPMSDIEFPACEADEKIAPWPWQVQEALGRVLERAGRQMEDDNYAKRWITEAVKLPWQTDEDAQLVRRVMLSYNIFRSPASLARLMDITKSPKCPYTSHLISYMAGGGRGGPLAHAMLVDIMQKCPSDGARRDAAYQMLRLRQPWRKERGQPLLSEPATAIIAASRLALATKGSDSWDTWNRYAGYASSVCRTVDNPPFDPRPQIDPESPLVKQRLKDFHKWYSANRKRLVAAAERERPGIEAARAYIRSRAILSPEPKHLLSPLKGM